MTRQGRLAVPTLSRASDGFAPIEFSRRAGATRSQTLKQPDQLPCEFDSTNPGENSEQPYGRDTVRGRWSGLVTEKSASVANYGYEVAGSRPILSLTAFRSRFLQPR